MVVVAAIVGLALGYLGGRFFPMGMALGRVSILFYGEPGKRRLEAGDTVTTIMHQHGVAHHDAWLADQLRQAADRLDSS